VGCTLIRNLQKCLILHLFLQELVQGSFFGFFQLRSSGYTPSKRQKLTKKRIFLLQAKNPEQAPNLLQ
jgi:hypothetical protein